PVATRPAAGRVRVWGWPLWSVLSVCMRGISNCATIRPEGLKCRSACHLKTGSSGPSSGTSQNRQRSGNAMDKVRIDKWLWAARFFKTRNLAKTAIEGGKVHCRGERCKPARDLRIGDE